MNEESKTELQKLLMQMYEKGANDAEAALKEAIAHGIDMAIKAEREECAKLFDAEVWSYDYREIAAAIRGRTE
jgi:vacuolar-type H+-ATPase subunit C/Vma6